MYHFLNMIQHVKDLGFDQDQGGSKDKNILQIFHEMVKDCEVFVFNNTVKHNNMAVPSKDESKIIAPPFKTISIEIIGKNVSICSSSRPDEGLIYHVLCIMVREVSPNTFIAFIYACVDYEDDESKFIVFPYTIPHENDIGNQHGALIEHYVDRIHNESEGVEKTKVKIKLGTGKGKKEIYKLSRIIHISPKSKRYEQSPETQKVVNWSHSWLVRGHWRRLKNPESIGKDREGNYSIKGSTFVTPHSKGEGSLIHKTRIVGRTIKPKS
jgi:hypothetical protein